MPTDWNAGAAFVDRLSPGRLQCDSVERPMGAKRDGFRRRYARDANPTGGETVRNGPLPGPVFEQACAIEVRT